MIKGIALAVLMTMPISTVYAGDKPADRWERSLLDAKKKGTLPGPRKGQKCLWSKKLGACLWYTPSKLDMNSFSLRNEP